MRVSATRAGGVTVSVIENPIISRITFEGNSAFDKAKLESLIELKPRGRYTNAKAHADALRIRELYKAQGRLATAVEPRPEHQPNGQIDIAFVIKESEVRKVESIGFVGNRALSAKELKDVISTSESGWFDILKTAAFYDPERVTYDRELITRHYRKNGFPDARVTAADAAQNEAGTGYRITFTIDEGPRYTVRAGPIDNRLPKVDVASLQPSVLLEEGTTYNEQKIEKSVEKMTLALSEQGHVFAHVRPVPVRDPGTNIIGIGFRIEEGPRAFAERIEIIGNTKTKDYVIRREFRIQEGDPVNALLLERARARVQALGFFKKVTLKRARGSAADKYVITIEVVEDDTRNLGFGIGYSAAEGIVGDLSIAENNLFGNGQRLGVKLAGSLTRMQADISFTEPRFLGTNIAAGFDIFYKNLDFTQYASYKSERVGGKVRATYPIDDNWTVGVNYSFVRSTLYDVGPNASLAIRDAVPGFPANTSNTYNTSSIGYMLGYDSRDNKKRPTSGISFTLSQDLAGLGGDVRYIRSVGEIKGYYPVAEGLTGVARASGGVITGWGGQDVRLLDLFYKGNDAVRGFAPAGIGPRDILSANADALGGRMFFSTSAELLFQIPGLPQDFGLRGAVFADAGSLWNTSKTAAALPGLAGNSLTPRASVGVGLGWDSPVGTLRVDYAFPVVKQPFDKTQPLSFGLSPF